MSPAAGRAGRPRPARPRHEPPGRAQSRRHGRRAGGVPAPPAGGAGSTRRRRAGRGAGGRSPVPPDERIAAVADDSPAAAADRAGAGASGSLPSPTVPAPPGSDDAPPRSGAAAPAADAAASGDGGRGAPLRLAHPDWLYHRLTVTGSPAALAAFQAAAAGAGIIPWQLDPARIAEDVFLRLVAPPPPQQRSLSLAGARILAGQLRDAAARRHDLALARVGHSRACPFDLHALLPVPENILRRGPDDPAALAWLWEHWGTTDALRHVTAEPAAGRGPPPPDRRVRAGRWHITFWSADWSPWRALAAIGEGFPGLRFDLRPSYDEAR